MELFSGLFIASASVGGLGLGLSPIFLLGGPNPKGLENSIRQLEESIKALERQ